MKAPRINGVTNESAPFAGDLPASLGPLLPYADPREGAAGLPVAAVATALPRLRRRAGTVPWFAIALLGASVVTFALALTFIFRAANKPANVPMPQAPPVVMATSGRDGVNTIHCVWDIVAVSVVRTPAFSGGVMTGWVDTPNETLRLVLHPSDAGFVGYLYSNAGILRTEPRAKGIAVPPDAHIVVRVDGLPDARELRVSGRETRMGSRWEGPCS